MGAGTGHAATADTAAARGGSVTLRHAPTGFSVRVPRGYRLRVREGVYVARKRKQVLSFSRSATSVPASDYGAALLGQLGGRVITRGGGASRFAAQIDAGGRRVAFVVARQGERLSVTTSSTPGRRPLALRTLGRIGASARGGFTLRPPPAAATSIPLGQYTAPDRGATLLVPTGPGWDISSQGGTVQGSSDQGAFLFGLSINIFLPETAPPGTPANLLVLPYLSAAEALQRIFPRFSPAVSEVQITGVIQDSVLPTFTSSGMYLVSYKLNGKPWTGAVTIATDGPERYGNYVWNLYYSGIGVPAGSDPAVGVGLLRAWSSWNPSGAIADRTRAAKALINETNEVWRRTSEFRARIADQQSRDVGCLLRGYPIIEDNAREFELPALPCGREYKESD